jgi:hypothetical protein
MNYSLFALVVLPTMFYIGGRLAGPGGVAWAWIIGYPLVMIPPFRLVFRQTGVTTVEYVSAMWPSILGSGAMAAAVLALRWLLPDSLPPLVSLVAESSLGALVYAGMMFGLQRDRVRVLRTMLRELRK